MTTCDVAIVGAGPYGLSTAAHLRAANGHSLRVFGEPMSFWQRHMPNGMFLRSPLVASNLSDPSSEFALAKFAAFRKFELTAPLPLDHFVEYGQWFQQKNVPDLDRRAVSTVESTTDGFQLTLADGEKFKSRRVVVAAGIVPFARRLTQFANLPSDLASHSCDHKDLTKFAGTNIAIIGGGQSALESAALLHEAGAKVEVFIRESVVRYLKQRPWVHKGIVGRTLYAWPDVGPAVLSRLVALPNMYKLFPRPLQNKWAARAIRAAGAEWLKPRMQKIPVFTSRWIEAAEPVEGGRRVKITLNDGTQRQVDHVLQSTGFQVDIRKYPFLDGQLLKRIRIIDGFPVLDSGFESSVPGLHFVGAPAAWSFGPLMRFVAGVGFACRTVTQRICR